MPIHETILQVFVASPADLADERAALEDVVRELNNTWSRSLHFRLSLVRWETHAVPGIGRDAQDVVNRSIPDDYDIFIGLLWSRFGTPTSRADSGTEEEFLTAFERHTASPDSIDIMFYFKDEPIAPSKLDPGQLKKIHDFRARLVGLGAFYESFNTVDDFQNLVRVHLSRIIQRWRDAPPHRQIAPNALDVSVQSSDPNIDAEDDEGFLDEMENAHESIDKLISLMPRMTETIVQLGAGMVTRTKELTDLHPELGSYDIKAAKRIMERAAADLDEFVARTKVEMPIFAEALSTTMRSFGRAASLSVEFGQRDQSVLLPIQRNLTSLSENVGRAKDTVIRLRDSLATHPRITSKYQKAKRRAMATMDSLAHEFELGTARISELESTIGEILRRFGPRDASEA